MAKQRQQQQTFDAPGMEREKIPELQDAAEDYRLLRDEEIQVGEKAKAAKARLITLMKQHSKTVFGYIDEEGNTRRVDLSVKENAKVKKIGSRGDDSPAETSGDGGGGDVEVH